MTVWQPPLRNQSNTCVLLAFWFEQLLDSPELWYPSCCCVDLRRLLWFKKIILRPGSCMKSIKFSPTNVWTRYFSMRVIMPYIGIHLSSISPTIENLKQINSSIFWQFCSALLTPQKSIVNDAIWSSSSFLALCTLLGTTDFDKFWFHVSDSAEIRRHSILPV
jgi:hypothetical protein